MKTPNDMWLSWGWSYDLPIEIEGGKSFTVVPFSKNDIVQEPDFDYYEGAGQLIDDTTGKVVGSSINESMDIRLLKNGPYGQNQH